MQRGRQADQSSDYLVIMERKVAFMAASRAQRTWSPCYRPTVGDARRRGACRHSKPWGERLLVPGLGTALIRSLMTEACGLEYLLGFLLDGDGIGGTSERNDTNVIVLIPMNA